MTVELLPAGSRWRVFHFSSVSLLETLATQSMASGREPLDLFGRFTRPTNIHHPAGSGVAFSYLENGELIGHPAKYAARRCQSSSRYSVQRTALGADSEAVGLRAWQRGT